MRLASVSTTIALLAIAAPAHTEPGGSIAAISTRERATTALPEGEPPPPSMPDAAALASAPPADETDGVVIPREDSPDRPWLRAALFVPRYTAAAVLAPARLALWTEERYRVSARAKELFWNDERTFGVYPVASWEGGQSLRGGVEVAHLDLGGATFRTRATAGLIERYHAAAMLGSGRRFGRVTLEAGFLARDHGGLPFYGYGDGDLADAPDGAPADPARDDLSVTTRFGSDELTGRAGAAWRVADGVVVAVGGSRRRLGFHAPSDRFDEPAIDAAYDIDAIPGFVEGIDAIREEVSLHVDRRRGSYEYQSVATPSRGWGAQIHAGWQHDLHDRHRGFGYGGIDAIRTFDLFAGDRTLTLRGSFDGVLGDRADIPFVDLPSLGGSERLRGYPSSRFRDRFTAAASAEYMYPVKAGLSGFVFLDAGRVVANPRELAQTAPRVSSGLGLQLQTRYAMVARAWVAATREGGMGFSISLEPVFRARGKEVVR